MERNNMTREWLLLWLVLVLETMAQQCTSDAYQRCLCYSGSPYCPCSSLTDTNALNFAATYRSHLVLVTGQGCRPCPSSCMKCSSLGVCSECRSAFELSGGRCVGCPINCGSCANGVCVSCLEGYYLDYQASCQSCPILGTKVCTISSLLSCLSNFYLDNNAAACVQCDPNCAKCSSTTKCSECLQGYYLTLEYTCALCSSLCSTCSSFASCLVCSNSTLYFDAASGNCLTGTVPHCLVFKSAAVCAVCDSSSYLTSSSQCASLNSSQLIANCERYSMLGNGTLTCSNCSAGLYNSSLACSFGCSLLCSSCYGPHYGLCFACQQNSLYYNLHCLPQYNIDGGSAFQLYYTAFNEPTFFSPSSIRSADSCLLEDIVGGNSSIAAVLSRLQSYKVRAKWKIYVYGVDPTTYNGSVSYSVTLSNSGGTLVESHYMEERVGDCASLTFVEKQELTATKLKDVNTLTFTSSAGLVGLAELLLVAYRCGGIQGAQCLQCSSTSQCTKCLNPKYYISGYTCLQSCPSGSYLRTATSTCLGSCSPGTYPDHSNLLCLECPSPCLTCPSSSACSSCVAGYFLLGSVCLGACPAGYYGDPLKKSCELCLRPCLSCISNLKCLSCLSGFYLAQTNSCVLSCGEGNFGNISSLNCQPCLPPCLTCAQYLGTQCTSCQPGYLYFSSDCLLSCPPGYVAEGSQCLFCEATCLTCTNSTALCTSCRQGKFLFNGTCLDSCLSTYYADAVEQKCENCPLNCLACLNSQQCFSCLNTTYLYSTNHTCLAQCPPGYFGSNSNCLNCQLPCLTCTAQTQCLTCSGLFMLNYSCVAECTASTFADTLSMLCLPCNSSVCLECFLAADRCTKCSSGLILFENSCLSACWAGYFLSVNGGCERCAENCVTCSGLSQCQQCLSSYVLSGGVCSKVCPNGFYQVTLNSVLTCQNCPCPTCLLSNSTLQCTSCSAGLVLSQGQCLPQCPPQHYSYLAQCFSCQSPCEECSSQAVCESCQSGFFLGGSCLTQCPFSYFPLSQACLSCSSSCLKCEYTASNCTACSPGLFLEEYRCISGCSQGFYLSAGNICRKCSSSCLLCQTNPYNCTQCLNQSFVLTNSRCLQHCSEAQFLNPNDNSCSPCPQGCLNCLNTSYCLSCTTNYYLNYNHSCSATCLSSFFPFAGLCRQCPYPCLTCSNSRTCLSCLSGFLFSGSCLSSCPTSTYLSNSQCLACAANCSQCLSGTECLECRLGVLVSGLCLGQCPSGFYSYYSICAPCMYGCLLCTDSSNCLSCSSGFLHQGRCLSLCPSGWVGTSGQCYQCAATCLTCLGAPSQCLTCVSGLFLYIFQCLASCPAGTYADYSSASCVTCHAPCATCENGFSCTTCIYGYILYAQPSGNQCIEGPLCPNSFYLDLSVNQCVFSCPGELYLQPLKATCSTPCPGTSVLLLSNRTCLQKCPPQMWIDSSLQCQDPPSPSVLPSFSCSALVVRNLLVIDCVFSTALANTGELQTGNFTVEGVNLTKLVFVSSQRIRLVTLSLKQAYQAQYLTVVLTWPYQLRAESSPSIGKVGTGAGGLPVQNVDAQVFITQYQSYTRDQRRTGLQLLQMAQSVCIGALIFWLLAALKNLKATSLAFVCTLQWLHSFSLIDMTFAPNFGQFLEGFQFANLFFSSSTETHPIWTLPNSYRQSLWGINNYFDPVTTFLPSLLLASCFLLLFLITHCLLRKLNPEQSQPERTSASVKAEEEGSEAAEEPSLISNVSTKQQVRNTVSQDLGKTKSTPQILPKLDSVKEEKPLEESEHSLRRDAQLDQVQQERQRAEWEEEKLKIGQKCKIINERFKFNYCFHLLLLTTSPLAIAFSCQVIAPTPLGLTASLLLLIFYLCVGVGVGRWLWSGGRLFVSSKFSLVSWVETLMLNGLVVLGTAEIYFGVSILLFLVNIYVWSRIFSSKRHQKLRCFHQAEELLRCLIILEALVVYTKTEAWTTSTVNNYSWIIIVSTFILIILAAVHSTQQFFESEPQPQPTENAVSARPPTESAETSQNPSKRGESRKESFAFSMSRKEEGEQQQWVREGAFFTVKEGEWDSESSEGDIIDFDERGDACEAPPGLIKLQKKHPD